MADRIRGWASCHRNKIVFLKEIGTRVQGEPEVSDKYRERPANNTNTIHNTVEHPVYDPTLRTGRWTL